METAQLQLIIEAVSRGEISRTEAERRLGAELSFGDMLLRLREHDLPLPRFPSDPNSPGVRLIRDLAIQAAYAG